MQAALDVKDLETKKFQMLGVNVGGVMVILVLNKSENTTKIASPQ